MTASQSRAKASFQTRLLLHLANRRRRSGAEAFTLVELMIVVAILGILAAVALPNYLQARSSAAMGSRISEAISFAKACAVYQSSGVGTAPNNSSGTPGTDGVSMSCPSISDGTVGATWGSSRADGVRCLTATTTSSNSKATITIVVAPAGSGDQIGCTLG